MSSLLMYYIVGWSHQGQTYLLLARHDLSEEVNVGGLKFGQIGMTIVGQEGIELLLAAALLG